jgi:hypothetical protein
MVSLNYLLRFDWTTVTNSLRKHFATNLHGIQISAPNLRDVATNTIAKTCQQSFMFPHVGVASLRRRAKQGPLANS